MAKRLKKDYYCDVVSEGVEIVLKLVRTISLDSKKTLFVQCNQGDCQYVEVNESPCPLNLSLFEEEIKERERMKAENNMN